MVLDTFFKIDIYKLSLRLQKDYENKNFVDVELTLERKSLKLSIIFILLDTLFKIDTSKILFRLITLPNRKFCQF